MNARRSIFLMFMLLTGFILVLYCNSWAFAAEDWQDLPPLMLQECIQVDKVLTPNPISNAENDLWMVLKYEEKAKDWHEADSAERPAGETASSLNVYLVTGLAVLAAQRVGVPYYSFLIVSLLQNGPSSEITQQWIFFDTDNDGTLDKGRFEKIVKDEDGLTRTGKMEIPKEQVQRFQDYYEKARRELKGRAEEDVSKHCSLS